MKQKPSPITLSAPRTFAVGYIRCSTNGQAENGVSLEVQEQKIRTWAELHGTHLLEIIVDEGLSATTDDRPGLQRALDIVAESHAALVVYSLSRLSRNTRDTLRIAERLQEADADLVSLSERIDTTTAAGKMVFRMLAVLNEFERDTISERTRAALAYRRAQGRKTGGLVPYGYDKTADGRLVRNPEEQRVIVRMVRRRQKDWTYDAIAQWLNSSGIATKNGRRWYAQTIKNVIRDSKDPRP